MVGAWISECEPRVVNGRLNELPYSMPRGIQQREYMLSNQRDRHMAAVAVLLHCRLFNYFVQVTSVH